MKIALVIFSVLAALLALWIIAGYLPTRNIETPEFKLLARTESYEIRLYAPRILAEVEVTGGYNRALNEGFKQVAGFIFGENTARSNIAMTAPVLHEKTAPKNIAMTAPVLHEKGDAPGAYRLAFVMPAAYGMDTLPKPNNARITIRAMPAAKFAVRSFGGYATESRVERETLELLEAAGKDHLTPAGKALAAQYNPPWTPPFMRRNEVMVEVR